MFIGAFDLGGTKTIVGLLSEASIIDSITFKTDKDNLSLHIQKCVSSLVALCAKHGIDVSDLDGIGATVPGIASEDGVLVHSAYSDWNGRNIRNLIREVTSVSNVRIENDVNACALAEMYYGGGLPFSHYLWITVSTGIGGALVLDGMLYRGSRFYAGEIGHVKVEYEMPWKCPSCGGSGCLEAHASGPAIARMFSEAVDSDKNLSMKVEKMGLPLDAESCAILARKGEEAALSCFEKASDYLARGIGYAVNILNPDAVVLGGGVANSFDLMYNQILQGLEKYVHPNLLPVRMERTRLGYMAGMMGAASLIVSQSSLKRG